MTDPTRPGFAQLAGRMYQLSDRARDLIADRRPRAAGWCARLAVRYARRSNAEFARIWRDYRAEFPADPA